MNAFFPGLRPSEWREFWIKRREARMEEAGKRFIDVAMSHPDDIERHLPRLLKTFKNSPKSVTGVAWILTCQEEIQKIRPGLAKQYHTHVLRLQEEPHVLAVLLRQRPKGCPVDPGAVEKIIRNDKEDGLGQHELLLMFIREMAIHRDLAPLSAYLAQANEKIRKEKLPHPMGELIKGWGKEHETVDLETVKGVVQLLNEHGLLDDYAGQGAGEYFLGKICQWVDDGKDFRPAIDQLLDQQVHWNTLDQGEGQAAERIRIHPAWRQAALTQQVEYAKTRENSPTPKM